MFFAVRHFLPKAQDYRLKYFKQDLLAGLTVAVVALPLSLAFGVTSGAGAAAGLTTAIVAGVLAAVFGGSNYQVSGPTGAMTVVLLPIVAEHGAGALLTVSFIAGILLLAAAFARIGRYVHYIPWPVVTGFTNGIAVVIFLQQLPGFLGVPKGEGESIITVSFHTLQTYLAAPTYSSVLLGLITVGVMLAWSQVKRLAAIPGSMGALLLVTLLSLVPFFAGVPRIGLIPSALPLPQLPVLSLAATSDLFRAALAVAILAMLESLLSAVMADSMTVSSRHDPDRELFGQGIANIAVGLFGGIPATAALARTAVNVRSGARTRLASIIHGLALLVIVLFLAPLAGVIPLAVLAGILMMVAWRMIEHDAVKLVFRATKSDAFVMVLTMAVTVIFDLLLAIEVGLIAAAILFIIRMSNIFSIDPMSLGTVAEPQAGLQEETLLRERVVAYRINGPIFFGAANSFFDQLLKVSPDIDVVILRVRRVPVIDATGVTALQNLIESLEHKGVTVFLSGLQKQPHSVLERTGVLGLLEAQGQAIFTTTEEALEAAFRRLKEQEKPREEAQKTLVSS